ncbi:hypothetical protein DRW41_05440 [Neobacillus piezotolerans]|uniref:DUF86 domain-containing protein n=1 Tax=Neobacillus piezotolerans TaxID=2259171 RepID=A0A3D8GSH7_9BACI|nr:hypothetical protein [Neobacillus piezotolerans]RDU37297.1 hypothetical protein DRW41_05440 [Neobacillus piezotolerans]
MEKERDDLSFSETNIMLQEAEELLINHYIKASYILTWVGLESIIRKRLKNESVKTEYNNPLQMIKNLYTFGLISREEYDYLQNQFKLRNLVVHGYKAPNLNEQVTKRLIKFSKGLI